MASSYSCYGMVMGPAWTSVEFAGVQSCATTAHTQVPEDNDVSSSVKVAPLAATSATGSPQSVSVWYFLKTM